MRCRRCGHRRRFRAFEGVLCAGAGAVAGGGAADFEVDAGGWMGGKTVARAAQFNVRRLAKRFIAGSDLPQTLEAIKELRRGRWRLR